MMTGRTGVDKSCGLDEPSKIFEEIFIIVTTIDYLFLMILQIKHKISFHFDYLLFG